MKQCHQLQIPFWAIKSMGGWKRDYFTIYNLINFMKSMNKQWWNYPTDNYKLQQHVVTYNVMSDEEIEQWGEVPVCMQAVALPTVGI